MAPKRTAVTVEVDGHELELSNLEKVLYPSGFTKGEVIDYYARIAPVALPHLRGRALTFKRFPNGTDTKGFFEKRCPATARSGSTSPSAPATARAASSTAASTRRRRWSGPPTWPPSSCTRRWRWPPTSSTPRAVVFDFDPGPNTDIADCCAIALRVRDVLAAVELEGCCKTSGSKGMQLYVPLNTPGVTHEAAAEFALAVGQVLEKQLPEAGHDGDGQGGAAGEDLRRLEPERPPQDDDRAVLAARPSGADGVDAGVVGRGRGVRRR